MEYGCSIHFSYFHGKQDKAAGRIVWMDVIGLDWILCRQQVSCVDAMHTLTDHIAIRTQKRCICQFSQEMVKRTN